MREKLVLVTGATAGIGFHTALGFAARGARVIITGRNIERGLRAQAVIRERAGHDRVHFLALDHHDVETTRELGARVGSAFERVDVLVNNVGGIHEASDSSAGRGAQASNPILDLNYLAAFALTDSLLAAMVTHGGGRIINLVPRTYARFRGDPFDARAVSGTPARSYACAKLLEILWTLALARDLEGSGVTVNAVDPGRTWASGAGTLSRDGLAYSRYVLPAMRLLTRRASVEQAAERLVALGVDPAFENVSGHHFASSLKSCPLDPRALDRRAQQDAVGFAVRSIARSVRPPLRAIVPLDLAVA